MTFMAALMLGTPHGGGAPSVSTARPKHAAAATSSSVSPAAVAEPVDGTHANVRTQGGSVTVRLASSTTDATQITANGPPTIRYAPLGAEATIGKDGGGARFTVGSDSHDSRLSGGIEVYDCNRTLLSTAECTILTMGQTAVEAGEAP